VTRQRQDNTPPGGWNGELALSLPEALWAYTVGPAIASGETHLKGQLKPGMLADLVVTAADPFAVDPADLWRIEVTHTFVGGRSVWERV
jgi:predicted amidohydrolase YtcJ